MTERPILFSAPMIHGIQADRKTQTRRVAKPRRRCSLLAGQGSSKPEWSDSYIMDPGNRDWLLDEAPCRPGDALWVREAWRADVAYDGMPPRDLAPQVAVFYEAGGVAGAGVPGRLRASMHMPRWASRITLTCTDVRVERLNDCTEADALAEGVVYDPNHDWFHVPGIEHPNPDFPVLARATAREMYAALWDTINGSGEWLRNPLVWVISFERVRA